MPNLIYSIPMPDMATLESEAMTLALATGWQAQVSNGNGQLIDNSVTYLEHGRLQINNYLQSTNTAYRANQAAEQARLAVIDASQQGYEQITTTLTIEE